MSTITKQNKRFEILSYEEVYAALSILAPSMVSVSFLMNSKCLVPTKLACFACMLHAPFSFVLHMHKAFSTNAVVRTLLYKFDVSFIHVQCLITGYAWSNRVQYHQIIYNLFCVLHIYLSDPLKNPNVKNKIDILTGLGVVDTSLGLLFRNIPHWTIAFFMWVILFRIYNKKLAGTHSSWIMHVMLAGPQYLVLNAFQYSIPTWGYM